MKPNAPRAVAISFLTLAGLAACAPTSPTFDRHFGETVPALRAMQTRNPDAPIANQSKSVDGLDGRAAREAIDRYQNTFTEPPPPVVNPFLIGVGSGAGETR